MTGRVREIWRHPIKSHGRERVASVTLTEGAALPWDRRWAVAHEASRFDDAAPAWTPCREFTRAAGSPALQAVAAQLDEATGRLTLSHPNRPDITITPEDPADAARFIDWASAITNSDRPQPARLVRAPAQAMTDSDYPSVSLINMASHAEVERQLGHAISPLRWRGNILFDGFAPWAETAWPAKRLRLGAVEMELVEPIRRCMATTANPETGLRDAETLKALNEGFGHQDCGVYARVTRGGPLSEGDTIEVLN
ncbi:MOSC domain-containing protein [Antarcticimicrobium luteum]|uniref:MOSC domain-containing protein n=1 Tax=Antarcticimicrobium luteum TaxID=2547397 RepID=A0A4R5UXN3_9RHOB|nr:MOSC N-terminal beta barrel domain-containing protein [Antarcticimicrobium luteum]TDK43885.1 MOSC domain-containing protein [Antarcticimicrobium luteum]